MKWPDSFFGRGKKESGNLASTDLSSNIFLILTESPELFFPTLIQGIKNESGHARLCYAMAIRTVTYE